LVESASVRTNVVSGNPINGREHETAGDFGGLAVPDDLQYACIFRLPTPRDCLQLDPMVDASDCFAGRF
jgi:hypothetical protein